MSAERPNAERLLREWLHQRMAAAQNLPFEDGDTCEECDEAVRTELLPLLQPVPSAMGQPPRMDPAVSKAVTEKLYSKAAQPSLEKLRELEADLRNAKCEGPPEIVKATLEGMHHIADRLRAVLAEFEKEGK